MVSGKSLFPAASGAFPKTQVMDGDLHPVPEHPCAGIDLCIHAQKQADTDGQDCEMF
jgi:hypothetical protein